MRKNGYSEGMGEIPGSGRATAWRGRRRMECEVYEHVDGAGLGGSIAATSRSSPGRTKPAGK